MKHFQEITIYSFFLAMYNTALPFYIPWLNEVINNTIHLLIFLHVVDVGQEAGGPGAGAQVARNLHVGQPVQQLEEGAGERVLFVSGLNLLQFLAHAGLAALAPHQPLRLDVLPNGVDVVWGTGQRR